MWGGCDLGEQYVGAPIDWMTHREHLFNKENSTFSCCPVHDDRRQLSQPIFVIDSHIDTEPVNSVMPASPSCAVI